MTSLAKAILNNQLRIEESMTAPFLKQPIIEPKPKAQMKGINPLKGIKEMDFIGDLQLSTQLHEIGRAHV